MKTLLFLLVILTLFAALPVEAQSTCPAGVLLDFARAASTCYGLEGEQACIGGAGVTAVGFDGQPVTGFSQIGDRVNVGVLRSLTLASVADSIPVVSLNVQANLTDAERRQVALLLIGAVTLENEITPLTEQVVFVSGSANLRATPQQDGDILARAGINESLVVNGRTQDGRWLRVRLRDTNAIVWVATEVVTGGTPNNLAVVQPDSPVYRPFETLHLTTGGGSLCDGALTDGLLLQTPSEETRVVLTLNGVQVELAGTFFITAEDAALSIAVLSGRAVVNAVFIPAGAQGTASGEAVTVVGYAADFLPGLPLANLPVFIRAAAPLDNDAIARAQADYAAELAAEAVQPQPTVEVVDTTCRRFVRRDVSLYAGPGSFYEAINEIQSGSAVDPVFQTTDPQGAVWYQLRRSNWIPAAQVVETGECPAIPVTTNFTAPRTNTISLETCETTNGPLRAGQQVTIRFTPPPWDNYPDARDSARIDPGHITIGSQRYTARATQAILIAGTIGEDDERWQRQFYIVWEAIPGTYRIEGDRLSYTPICTITVPVGG
ncbi:MAG: hypothetical protein H6672_02310 [Anaerolineaceae bacterium]|nr:hypothetical protein [Anaerolineaceae bacterium]